MGKYQLIVMSFDGEYITETDSFNRNGFDTVEAAWEHENDMGSKWFFYPFPFVTTASGKTVVDTPYGFDKFRGKRVDTVKRIFRAASELPELQGADYDRYVAVMREVEF
jgi:hypothetical protein